MDLYSDKCIGLLKAISKTNLELGYLEEKLRVFPSVVKVRGGIDVRDYRSGVSVERYVEADLKTGANICWWLELSAPTAGNWLLDARIYFSHGDTIHEFPSRSIECLDNVFEELQASSTELLESIASVPNLAEILSIQGAS